MMKPAKRLRNQGYEVTEHVGGTGLVALLRNGAGPTVLLRTELDALPDSLRIKIYGRTWVRTADNYRPDRYCRANHSQSADHSLA